MFNRSTFCKKENQETFFIPFSFSYHFFSNDFQMVSSLIILGSLSFVVLSFLINRIYKPIGYTSIPGPALRLSTRLLMFIQLHFLQTLPEFTEFWCKLYGDT